jgi:preprotein translocase subunit SecE
MSLDGRNVMESITSDPPPFRTLVWRKLYQIWCSMTKTLRYLIAVAVMVAVMVSLVVIINTYEVTTLFPLQITRRPKGLSTPPRPTLAATFATFPSIWPHANNGTEWEVFNDNKFLNRSSAWYETLPSPETAGHHFLRIHYSLLRGERSLIADAYCGIYVDFNPPLGSVDISRYSAMALRARIVSGTAPPAHFFVSLANPWIKNYAYHQYEVTPLLREGAFVDIIIPFSILRQPDFATAQEPVARPFDASDVFRLSFIIKGVAGEGALDLDQIVFVEN